MAAAPLPPPSLMIPYFWMMDSGEPVDGLVGHRASWRLCLLRAWQEASRRFSPSCFRRICAIPELAGAREFGAIAGGAIPLIAAALSAAYASALPVAIFVICMCLVTVVAVSLAPETRGRQVGVELALATKDP